MVLVKNVEVTINGILDNVDVECYSRGGTKSPTLEIIIYKGRRLVPIAQRGLRLQYTLSGLFKLIYSPGIDKLIPLENPFLKLIPPDKGSLYHQPIILPLVY